MDESIFREGGPLGFKRLGGDKFSATVSLPTDPDGLLGRECPAACLPGYFKIRPGTGIATPGYDRAFCPYCRREGTQHDFHTKAQLDFVQSLVEREAHDGVTRVLKKALGLGPSGRKKLDGGLFSIEVSLKPGTKPPIRHPEEERLRRDSTCPSCSLTHAVFGLATWCPDCGRDIFLVHLQAEFDVIRAMLRDVEDRRRRLGARVASRDVENALEDVVSAFEGALKVLARRKLRESLDEEGVAKRLAELGTSFQTLSKAAENVMSILSIELFEGVAAAEVDAAKKAFLKRHLGTHNLGVVDERYLAQTGSGELAGREVPLVLEEVASVVEFCHDVVARLYRQAFGADRKEPDR